MIIKITDTVTWNKTGDEVPAIYVEVVSSKDTETPRDAAEAYLKVVEILTKAKE